MEKDVEERKVVGSFVVNRFVAIEEVSATEPIVVGMFVGHPEGQLHSP